MATPDAGSSALDALLQRHGSLVRLVGHRVRLDPGDLDEVLQDVRIRIWRANPDADTLARTSATYVYRTAMSAAVDLLRRRRHRPTVPFPDDSLADPRSRTSQAAESTDLAEAVFRAVGALIETRRRVVQMYLVGYERTEIAEILGWSEAKIRNLLHRGLNDLRRELRSAGIGPEEAYDE
jgi:RNA polymerase sigma-70 factor (ECF subfamily)